MPHRRPLPAFSPARLSQIHKFVAIAILVLVLLGMAADISNTSPRGPYDWRQRVIVLLPGVCAQPAALPPTPNLPPIPFASQPYQWPSWPDWMTCGGAQARLDARARALNTFVGGYGSPAQLIEKLNQALQNSAGANQSGQGTPFTIRAIEAFSYAGNTLTYESSQTRQPLSLSAQALDAQFQHWQREYPGATFDLIGHSLGGAIATYWAANDASSGELRAIHAIITLDSPLGGYPLNYADNFFLPFFGPVARNLLADSPDIQTIKNLPAHWIDGPGTLASALVTIENVRDLVVPFFLATIPGAVLVADDYGSDSSSLNHGAVLTSPSAFVEIAQIMAQPGMPLLYATTSR